MKIKDLFNVLSDFDFNLLSNPEFKEDSVREEIILPIIKGIGYNANRPHQIIRSRNLLHPFVSIGSKRKEIFIVPDYLFEVNGKPVWILDAKSPKESIIKSSHVEQAYSYAIHPEVRVNYFALCNGKEFALYSIDSSKPLMHFPIQSIPLYWESIKKLLSPQTITSVFKPAKDLGLHLKRLGFNAYESLIFPDVPITHIGQLDNDMFSFSSGVKIDESNYLVTFDFNIEILNQFEGKIPDQALEKLRVRNSNSRELVSFADRAYLVTIDSRMDEKLEENEDEIFMPLMINRLI